jgi:hypothetical protein
MRPDGASGLHFWAPSHERYYRTRGLRNRVCLDMNDMIGGLGEWQCIGHDEQCTGMISGPNQ